MLRAAVLSAAGAVLLLAAVSGPALAAAGDSPAAGARAQRDSIGFAITEADMRAVIDAAREAEGGAVAAVRAEKGLGEEPWVAAIMPHDDYLYAGRVDLHLLPGLKAPRWIVFGVCHACRRLGVRDRLVFDSYPAWNVAGRDVPVADGLRAELLAHLPRGLAAVDDERHAAEHSIEALLPWLVEAVPEAEFVPVLVPGMDWPDMREAACDFATVLARICRQRDWRPGVDVGILISADAVHYGCEGWGPSGGHHPFGCDEAGHAAGAARDVMLAESTLAGPLNIDGLDRFVRLVWKPGDPTEPYRITWCGIYSIPFGLATAARWRQSLDRPPLVGHLLRYGDSVTDGRLEARTEHLGVTAPNTLAHWVGYPALGYVAEAGSASRIEEGKMPDIGDMAPDFTLLNQDGEKISLGDFRGRRVVLFAYPKAATPGCTKQACGFADKHPRLEAEGVVVLGVSPDQPEKLKKWHQKQGFPYDLLSDPDHEVLERWGAWGEKSMYGKKYMGVIRSHWIIGEDGRILDAQIKVSPQKSVDLAAEFLGG